MMTQNPLERCSARLMLAGSALNYAAVCAGIGLVVVGCAAPSEGSGARHDATDVVQTGQAGDAPGDTAHGVTDATSGGEDHPDARSQTDAPQVDDARRPSESSSDPTGSDSSGSDSADSDSSGGSASSGWLGGSADVGANPGSAAGGASRAMDTERVAERDERAPAATGASIDSSPSDSGHVSGSSAQPAQPSEVASSREPTPDQPAGTDAFADDVPRVDLPNVTHVWQKWNNCGPSSMLMALSAHGVMRDQLDVAAQLKPNRNDTNVTPAELARYAREQGMGAFVGNHLTVDAIKRLLRTGTPVIAEHWIDVHGRGEMGHYRVAIGYDDASRTIIAQDSYYGARRTYSYDEFMAMSRPFLGAFVAVFPLDREPLVVTALGPLANQHAAWSEAAARFEAEVAANPADRWAWFALGEAKSQIGDHEGSVAAFKQAISIGLPQRTFWYQFGYYEALFETGRFDEVVAHADATLASMQHENLEESHYWKGRALQALGRPDDARASFQRAIDFNPLFAAPREALAGLSVP